MLKTSLNNTCKNLSLVLAIFFLIQLSSAVNLDSGTVLNTTNSNSSMTFNTCIWNVTQVQVTPRAVEITNGGELTANGITYLFPVLVNHTAYNTNYNCEEIGEEFGITSYPDTTATGFCRATTQGIGGFGGDMVIIVIAVAIAFIVGLLGVFQKNTSWDISIGASIATLVFVAILFIIGVTILDSICSSI